MTERLVNLNRREFGTVAGVSLSSILAGCSTSDDNSDDDDGNSDENEDLGEEFDNNSDAEDSDTETNENGEEEMHEDESIPGQILLSDDAIDHIDVVQYAFSWLGEPSSDQCHVHIMLENTSDAELLVDMEARIFDEDGTDLSSTREIGVTGPEPGEDDAVYSFELDNCEETAEYRLDISNLEVTDDSTEEDEESVEETDDSDEQTEEDERDGGDEEADDENEEAEDEDEDVEGEDEDDSTEQDNADGDDDEQVDSEDDSADEEDEDDDADEEDENDVVAGTHTLRATVQDGDGDPIDHAIVGITEGGSDGWSDTQNVDSQGQAEFEIEAGEYTLIAEADGYPTLERDIESDTNVEYTLTLRTNN